MNTDIHPQPTPPEPSSRLLLLRAAVTGVVPGASRALVTWLLHQH